MIWVMDSIKKNLIISFIGNCLKNNEDRNKADNHTWNKSWKTVDMYICIYTCTIKLLTTA
jgi:hypothetical protein